MRFALRVGSLSLACALALWLASAPRLAAAQSPYTLDLRVDLPVLGLGLAGSMIVLTEVPPPACYPDCSRADVNAFDRTALGHYSPATRTAADIAVFSLIGLTFALDALDSGGDGWLEDSVVFLQTLLVTQALVQLTKHAVRRPAPFVYDPDVPAEDVRAKDAARSFFSGHTATAFAMTTAFSVTYFLRHPDDPLRWLVLGTGIALSLGVGIAKVFAGHHFWPDIAAGALAGASIGVLVPILHVQD
jgi:membrane-associated phospholipid phosphatase